MRNKTNCFILVLTICGLAVLGISLFVYTRRLVAFKLPLTGTSVSVPPEDSDKAGLAAYPDLPLALIPKESVTVKFVVEHRSSLNKKLIKVRGVVVETLLGERACPPGFGMCGQPRVFLADTTGEDRNKLYDLTVIVDEGKESGYSVGEVVEIEGTVEGSKTAVIVRK